MFLCSIVDYAGDGIMKDRRIKDVVDLEKNNKWLGFKVFSAPIISIFLFACYWSYYITKPLGSVSYAYTITAFYLFLIIYKLFIYIKIKKANSFGYSMLMFDIIFMCIIYTASILLQMDYTSIFLIVVSIIITALNIYYFEKRKHYWLGEVVEANNRKLESNKSNPIVIEQLKNIEDVEEKVTIVETIEGDSKKELRKNKIRYCSKCGSLIDKNKKCTGCGKQYFNVKFKPYWVFLFFLFAGLTAIIIFQFMQSFKYKNQISGLETRCELVGSNYSKLLDDYNELKGINTSYLKKINEISIKSEEWRAQYADSLDEIIYYENNAAIVVPGGTLYHTINCPLLDGEDIIYIYSVPDAEDMGYARCPACH